MSSVIIAGNTSGTITLDAPAVAGTTTLTLPTTNGTITTKDTNGILSVNGIQFPATQSASADANTLDDYEEGSWTPTILFGGASAGVTYGVQQASYIKIGKSVFVQFRVSLSNKGSSTGAANVGGLPFAASGTANIGYPAGTYTFEAGGVSLPNGLFCIAFSDSTLYLRANNGGTGFTSLFNSNFSNSSEIWGSITYQT
jgi:hypothetical protein